MTAFSREARLSAISAQRERFSRAASASDRDATAEAILAELHLMLDDAWVRTLSASALSPAVLGAMVRSERLAFEHLRECLDADPRWSDGVALLVSSLTDAQVAMLDASLSSPTDQRTRGALRCALAFAERIPTGPVPIEELLAVGWSSFEIMAKRECVVAHAAAFYARQRTIAEPSLFELAELASVLGYVEPSVERDRELRAIIDRTVEILAERAPDDDSAEVRVALSDLARACVALGEVARAESLLGRLQAMIEPGQEEGLELLFWANRPVLAACAAEERASRERALIAQLPEGCSVRLLRVALTTTEYRSEEFTQRVEEDLARWLDRAESLSPEGRAELASQVAMGAEHFSSRAVDRCAEMQARFVRSSPLMDYNARVLLDFARAGSEPARLFIERTAKQRTIAWWDDPGVYGRLPPATLAVVLDETLRSHRPRWPIATVDALRWLSTELSTAAAQRVDALVGSAPVEQRAERAISAIGRAILRLGDRGRDAESSRVAAKLAGGEFASSAAFDRVWWELGETAQRAAWLARPTRADRVGWLVPKRVIETLAGVECAERYAKALEAWIERTARACGAR